MGFLSFPLILLYSVVTSTAICFYFYDIALLDSSGFVPFLASLSLAIATFLFGELILHKLTLRLTRHQKKNILLTLPTSLLLQLLIMTALVALRTNALVAPIIHHTVSFALIIIVTIIISNFLSIRLFKKIGLNITTNKYAKLIHAILIPIIVLVPIVMYTRDSSSSDKSIILITVDSWRYDAVNFRTPDIITPNIDKLHQTGVTFDHFYTHAPYTWTSLSSVMTSLESPIHGVRENGQPLDEKCLTLAEVLSARGYRCFVSADLNVDLMRLNQGFSELSFTRELVIRALHKLNMLVGRVFPGVFEKYCFAPNDSMFTTMKALDFLHGNRAERFFMWIHYYNEPHVPYIAPPYYTDLYNKGKSSWIDGRTETIKALRGVPEFQHLVDGKTLSDEDLEYLKNLYKAEVTTVDVQLGMILENLRRSDLLDNVLIVLTADHGEDFAERGQYLHGSNLYGGLLHVPMIIRLPQRTENITVSSIARGIDIAPTILDYAGIAAPSQFHGSSMLGLVGRDDKMQGDKWAFAETLEYGLEYPYDGYAFSYTSSKYKYIFAPLERREELYDLETDPHEKVNIAAANRAIILDIQEALKNYFGLEDVMELIPVQKPEIGDKQLKMLRTLGYID